MRISLQHQPLTLTEPFVFDIEKLPFSRALVFARARNELEAISQK